MEVHPSLSTDQVAAFVELARTGSLRRAADTLLITEQGVRNRLLALEQRLGMELYHKSRGLRRRPPLTPRGQEFLPHAVAFLHRARDLCDLFESSSGPREVHVAASQYLILYVLIDAVRSFHAEFPQIRIRLSTHTEEEVEQALLADPAISLGVAAPQQSPSELEYQHLFSMGWSLITPPRHRLLRTKDLRLEHLVDQPLILFERGSTGRAHVFEAFHEQGLSPRVEMETTNTEIIVRMVAAGLGVSIVPLLPGGAVTRGRGVSTRSLGEQIRPIHSGLLVRRGDPLSPAAARFADFIRQDRRWEK